MKQVHQAAQLYYWSSSLCAAKKKKKSLWRTGCLRVHQLIGRHPCHWLLVGRARSCRARRLLNGFLWMTPSWFMRKTQTDTGRRLFECDFKCVTTLSQLVSPCYAAIFLSAQTGVSFSRAQKQFVCCLPFSLQGTTFQTPMWHFVLSPVLCSPSHFPCHHTFLPFLFFLSLMPFFSLTLSLPQLQTASSSDSCTFSSSFIKLHTEMWSLVQRVCLACLSL